MDSKTSDEKLREEFEAIFPRPRQCEWIGNGFVATDYNAWSAHSHIDRWAGYRAASSARSEEMDKLRQALSQVRVCIELQRDVVEHGRHVKAWAPVIKMIEDALTPTEKPAQDDDEICHCPCCKQGIEAPHEYHLERRPMAAMKEPRHG